MLSPGGPPEINKEKESTNQSVEHLKPRGRARQPKLGAFRAFFQKASYANYSNIFIFSQSF